MEPRSPIFLQILYAFFSNKWFAYPGPVSEVGVPVGHDGGPVVGGEVAQLLQRADYHFVLNTRTAGGHTIYQGNSKLI